MARKKNPGPAKRTVHRFILSVAAPSKASANDVLAAVELLIRAGQTDLDESLELPEEERWNTDLAAELRRFKLIPLKRHHEPRISRFQRR